MMLPMNMRYRFEWPGVCSYGQRPYVEALREKGAAVDAEDVVRGLGYGAAGVSGLSASAEMSVAGINGLLQQMAADVV